MSLNFITAQEAASVIKNNDNVGFSGFTPAGAPKVLAQALAEKAQAEKQAGREFKIGMFTGASTGDSLDGVLARAEAIKFRTPYQSNSDMRSCINKGGIPYFDLHLSQIAQELRYGYYGKVNVAVIEAADVNEKGEILLTTGVGITPTVAHMADKIIIELNSQHPAYINGLHDLYEPADPPYRREIQIYKPSDRIGETLLKVDPSKIVGVVKTHLPDEVKAFAEPDETTKCIGDRVAGFLVSEMKAGRIPASFLPLQSGVGNIANAVLGSLGASPDIPAFEMFTEVIQDSVIEMMQSGNVKFASGCSLTITPSALDSIYRNWDFFKNKLVLRPQEISNSPELARRMGLITMNTALEADIFGNVNSTHVLGTKMMNGIGGSGDFTRNSYLSIFTCPSTAKGGKISALVPMVSHTDHSEHSVKILITEQGVADLRGKSPLQKAHTIIENCVHPDYKQMLTDYLKQTKGGCTPHSLGKCFNMHQEFLDSGDMRNTKW
ncbi:MAG: acetyl-CoA hydrolase/transferase family protein [Bacteroidales bacterium]|nr:acetyl-CoA hydrolase/transferase family protein [Bacteroidales bacterium]